MVGRKGLEPSHLAARDPKSRVSTNSTTGPLIFRFYVDLEELTTMKVNITEYWGERGDSNPRHRPPQGRALTN